MENAENAEFNRRLACRPPSHGGGSENAEQRRNPLVAPGRHGELAAPPRADVLFTLSGYAAPRANAYLDTLFGWTARQGSLTVAAKRRLHTAQPSLSRQIRDLEYEVGVKLLIRSA